MKLILGKDYKYFFLVFLVIVIICSFIPYPFEIKEPAFLGVAISMLFLVLCQAYSGIALDRFWIASVTKAERTLLFTSALAFQLFISLIAIISAF